jgi:hypothetical protein
MEKQVYEVRVGDNGDCEWYQNDKRHRLDGPAIECANGDRYWYQNGKLHRADGPAIEYANGTRYWYQNGKLHRLDGPAVEWANGSKQYWIDGKYLTEAEFNARIKPACDGKEVMIEGKKYRLTAID